jgi:hypothetical protein
MKKIYTLIGAIAVTSAVFAQDFTKKQFQRYTGPYSLNKSNQVKKTTANIDVMVSPVDGILATKGTPTTDYALFLAPVLCDSTLVFSPAQSNGDNKADCALGYVLDPKSAFVSGDANPILDAATPYTIDSLFIPGVYRRVAGSTAVDTLYTYLTYAAATPSNTAINLNLTHAQLWIAPMSTWAGNLAAMRVVLGTGTGTNTVPFPAGRPLAPVAAAAATTIRVKTLMSASTPTDGVAVKLTTPLNVPAGNYVAAYYTYVPGGTHTNGEVYFSFQGGAAQTQNGFSGLIAQQTAAVAAAADILDIFNCPDGTSHTLGWSKKNRYNQGTNNTLVLHQLLQDVIMEFHLTAVTVGVEELEKKGFALGQNTPNPFANGSNVSFQLAKDVNSAVFTVTDVMGRIVSSENVETTSGKHTIKLGTYAAGVYYYSLNVDGNVTTKKMIAQ